MYVQLPADEEGEEAGAAGAVLLELFRVGLVHGVDRRGVGRFVAVLELARMFPFPGRLGAFLLGTPI